MGLVLSFISSLKILTSAQEAILELRSKVISVSNICVVPLLLEFITVSVSCIITTLNYYIYLYIHVNIYIAVSNISI